MTQDKHQEALRLVNAEALQMVINALRRDAEEGRTVRGEMADALLTATQPVMQGMDAQLVAFIAKVRDFKVQAVRVGAKEGEIRWDIEFGHYGAEVRGKTLRDAITKALAVQAKHGGHP